MIDWIPTGTGLVLVLKATLLLSVAALVSLLLRRSRASIRHLVWTVGVVAVLALPAATAVVPSWHVLPARPATVPSTVQRDAGTAVIDGRAFDALAPGGATAVRSVPAPSAASARAWRPERMALAAWGVGVLLLLARFAWGVGICWWLARRAAPVQDREWLQRLGAHRTRLGVKRPVRLLSSAGTRMPMTFGVSSPTIIVPSDAGTWSAERRDVVLLHELAHIRRGDALTLAAAQAMRALHWFNPLARMALHRVRAEAERACDDDVLNAGTRASTYADHLLELVRQVGRAPIPAAAVLPMARRAGFEGRLLAILEPAAARGRVRPLHAALAGASMLVLLLGIAALTPERATGLPMLTDADEPAASDAIEDAVREADFETAQSAAAAESTSAEAQVVPPAVVQGLVAAIGDVDVSVRVAAVKALGELSDTTAARALIRALQGDADGEVRKMAAWALGNLEYEPAVAALGEVLKGDRELPVRAMAAWALGNIESESAVDALVAALTASDAEVRRQSVWALGQIESERAVPGLVRLVDDADAEVREQVVWALGQIESADAVPALVRLLRDGNENVRRQSAWALGQIESATATEPLAQLLAGDASAEVRGQAAWALGQIEPGSAPKALLDAVKDRSAEVRRMAVWALSQIEDPASTPALREALKDSDLETRRMAVRALAEFGDEAARDALLEMLKSDDVEVRRDAAAALGNGRWNVDPKPQPQPRPQPRPGGGD
jgi:HEAT repeat protein